LSILTRLARGLGRRALGALLALDALRAALGRVGGVLRLLGLLAALRRGLLFLGFRDGLLARGGPGLGAHVAALLDHIEGGADDGTLVLDGTAGALLGNFLLFYSVSSAAASVAIRLYPPSIMACFPQIPMPHFRNSRERGY
jgi:hypothetical protein